MQRTGIMGFVMAMAASVGVVLAGTPADIDGQRDSVLLATNLVVTRPPLPRLEVSTQQVASVYLSRVPLVSFRTDRVEIKPVGFAAPLSPLIVLAWDVVAPLGGKRPLAETAAGRLFDRAHKALLQAGPDSSEFKEAMATYQTYHQQALARMAVFRDLDVMRSRVSRGSPSAGP
jgi:hypothetical protein